MDNKLKLAYFNEDTGTFAYFTLPMKHKVQLNNEVNVQQEATRLVNMALDTLSFLGAAESDPNYIEFPLELYENIEEKDINLLILATCNENSKELLSKKLFVEIPRNISTLYKDERTGDILNCSLIGIKSAMLVKEDKNLIQCNVISYSSMQFNFTQLSTASNG